MAQNHTHTAHPNGGVILAPGKGGAYQNSSLHEYSCCTTCGAIHVAQSARSTISAAIDVEKNCT
eukprot:7709880-Pyramimonas_sp.AAC.1